MVASLVGPGRGVVAVRGRAVVGARFVGQKARRLRAVAVAEGPGFARAHLDALRIGGVVAAGVLVLFFTSWTGLLWIAAVLALYELLVAAVAAIDHGSTGGFSRAAGESAQRGGTVSPHDIHETAVACQVHEGAQPLVTLVLPRQAA